MAKVEITGQGFCPRCSSPTEIKRVESFPFPEEEQIQIREICTNCDFDYEKDFSSSNATTAFEHNVSREIREENTPGV